jgi:hypothetical protein
MARGKSANDIVTLQMALVGYQIERQRIDEKISELQAQLKGQGVRASGIEPIGGAVRKRELSPAARRRISAAQKKRWAEHRKRAAQAAKHGR